MVASKVGITVEAALNHVCRFHMDARCCSFGKEGPRGRITRRECAQVCRNPNTVSEAAAALPRVLTARGALRPRCLLISSAPPVSGLPPLSDVCSGLSSPSDLSPLAAAFKMTACHPCVFGEKSLPLPCPLFFGRARGLWKFLGPGVEPAPQL